MGYYQMSKNVNTVGTTGIYAGLLFCKLSSKGIRITMKQVVHKEKIYVIKNRLTKI